MGGRNIKEKKNQRNSSTLFESQPWEFKLGFFQPWRGKKTQISWVEISSQTIRGLQMTCSLWCFTAAQPQFSLSHQLLREAISYCRAVWMWDIKRKGWVRGHRDQCFHLPVMEDEEQGEKALAESTEVGLSHPEITIKSCISWSHKGSQHMWKGLEKMKEQQEAPHKLNNQCDCWELTNCSVDGFYTQTDTGLSAISKVVFKYQHQLMPAATPKYWHKLSVLKETISLL